MTNIDWVTEFGGLASSIPFETRRTPPCFSREVTICEVVGLELKWRLS
jgi:hypothetical protein